MPLLSGLSRTDWYSQPLLLFLSLPSTSPSPSMALSVIFPSLSASVPSRGPFLSRWTVRFHQFAPPHQATSKDCTGMITPDIATFVFVSGFCHWIILTISCSDVTWQASKFSTRLLVFRFLSILFITQFASSSLLSLLACLLLLTWMCSNCIQLWISRSKCYHAPLVVSARRTNTRRGSPEHTCFFVSLQQRPKQLQLLLQKNHNPSLLPLLPSLLLPFLLLPLDFLLLLSHSHNLHFSSSVSPNFSEADPQFFISVLSFELPSVRCFITDLTSIWFCFFLRSPFPVVSEHLSLFLSSCSTCCFAFCCVLSAFSLSPFGRFSSLFLLLHTACVSSFHPGTFPASRNDPDPLACVASDLLFPSVFLHCSSSLCLLLHNHFSSLSSIRFYPTLLREEEVTIDSAVSAQSSRFSDFLHSFLFSSLSLFLHCSFLSFLISFLFPSSSFAWSSPPLLLFLPFSLSGEKQKSWHKTPLYFLRANEKNPDPQSMFVCASPANNNVIKMWSENGNENEERYVF